MCVTTCLGHLGFRCTRVPDSQSLDALTLFLLPPGLRENRRHPATYLLHGAKALATAFRSWTRKEVVKTFLPSVGAGPEWVELSAGAGWERRGWVPEP